MESAILPNSSVPHILRRNADLLKIQLMMGQEAKVKTFPNSLLNKEKLMKSVKN